MKKVITILLVCVLFCSTFAMTAYAETDKISPVLQEQLNTADPEETINLSVWLVYSSVSDSSPSQVMIFHEEEDEDVDLETARAYRDAAKQEKKEYYTKNNQTILEEILKIVDVDVNWVSNYTPLVELTIKVKDVEKLAQLNHVGYIEPNYPAVVPGGEEVADPIMDKIESGLQSALSTYPEDIDICVAVERVVTHPVTIEDMPAYVSGDKESYVTARHQLAEYNKRLNEEFIKELSEYAEFEAKMNTITTIVLLKLKAKDVYALAKCDSVFEINYISEQKWSEQAGEYKLLGDTDGDASVTILDATGIQRELAELGVAVFDEECADYDEDGDVTILDATAIQRTLADM